MSQTSMLHVRVDEKLKAQAASALESHGMTISDAVRILLARVARDGGLPPGLACDEASYDAWFRAKVREALLDSAPGVAHETVIDEAQAVIDGKRHGRS